MIIFKDNSITTLINAPLSIGTYPIEAKNIEIRTTYILTHQNLSFCNLASTLPSTIKSPRSDKVEIFLAELVSRGHARVSEWPSDFPIAVADLGLEIHKEVGRLSVTEPIIELDIPYLRDTLAKTEPSLDLSYSRLVSSTNTMLVDSYSNGNNSDSLFLCEFQYEGRGRFSFRKKMVFCFY